MNRDSRIYVAGSATFVGGALVRYLRGQGFRNVTGDLPQAQLTDANYVGGLYRRYQPEYVFIAAGPSGGIEFNRMQPADLMVDNLRIATNLIEGAYRVGVSKLLYLASSCCYPRDCRQPMRESELWNGPVEPTSDAYATAKRSGIMLCDALRRQHGARFIAVIPSTPYGPGEWGGEAKSHVVAALLHRITAARKSGAPSVKVWGTGNPIREFIHVDDLASACAHLMREYDEEGPINVGVGQGHTIRELAECISSVVGYEGALEYDSSKPDGAPEKVLDSSRLFGTGWRPSMSLREGIENTYGQPAIERPRHAKAS